jgi:hypothetical protein
MTHASARTRRARLRLWLLLRRRCCGWLGPRLFISRSTLSERMTRSNASTDSLVVDALFLRVA